MGTYTQLLYQIVFTTKNSETTLIESDQESLNKYIAVILKTKKCHLYRIGGVEDHIHIVTHIHQNIALTDLVKDIKLASVDLIKSGMFFLNLMDGKQNMVRSLIHCLL